MPRKPIERSRSNYYHITARSNNREFFYLPILNVWDIMTRKLADLQKEFGIKISAFVLMNNHFHLLVLTPNEDIDRVMYFFMKDVTLEIQKCTGRINKIFGGRYKGSMIDNYGYLVNVYKYIYPNPIEVGITTRAELHPYSSLFHVTQPYARLPFKIQKIIPPHAFDAYEELDEITIRDYSSVIVFNHQASIVIFVPFEIRNATSLKEIVHKKLLGIEGKNRIVTLRFTDGVEILVDTKDENLNGPEIFQFRIQQTDVIVRSDDLDSFFEHLKL